MIFIYILIALIILILLVALILPKTYKINKSIIINNSAINCFNIIADLNQYHSWNPFYKLEPTATTQIDGTPKTIGHQYTWDGKKIGVGALTIIAVTENKMVEFELEFLKPFASKAYDKWTLEQLPDNQIKINWHNTGVLAFPIARLMGPFITKNLNSQFDQGLTNIKQLLQK